LNNSYGGAALQYVLSSLYYCAGTRAALKKDFFMKLPALGRRTFTAHSIALAIAVSGLVLAVHPAQANGDKSPARKWSRVDIGDAKISLFPYIGTESGYDSNPDGLVNGKSTRYIKLSAGATIKARRRSQSYRLTLKGRRYEFLDFDSEKNSRYDLSGALDTVFKLAPGQKLKLGSLFHRDFISLSTVDVLNSYGDYVRIGKGYKLRLQAKSRIEYNKNDDSNLATLNRDIFDVIRSRAFDYSKTQGQIALLTFTKSVFQPFFIYNFADINYFHQAPNPIYNRTAQEHWGIAGVRMRPTRTFRIDFGARYNFRDLEDKDFSTLQTSYIDLNFAWRPVRPLKITGVIERTLQEPSTSFGLVDDVITFGTTLSYKVTPTFRIYAAGYYDHVKAVGDDIIKKKYSARLTATYSPKDAVDVYITGYGRRVDELTFNESYNRLKIGAGIKMRF